MKKRKFLADLEERLEEKEFELKEIERIINDYESLIDEAVEDGKDEAMFIEALGTVKEIVSNLGKSLPKAKKKEHILVALSPFIALISFFLIGFFLNAWHPGWLVFLGIPIIAILTESRNPKRLIGLFPIVYTVFYILVGTYGLIEVQLFTELFSFLNLSFGGLWHPLWAGYLYTAVLAYFFDNSLRRKIIGLISFILVTSYITLELVNGFSLWHLLFILAFIIIAMAEGTLKFVIDIKLETKNQKTITFITLGTALLIAIIYIILGLTYNTWGIMWVLFLLIPMVAIFLDQYLGISKFEVTPYTPFIATILFFLTGVYFNLFAISWLFFLIIPISAILEEQLKPKKR